jgi:hypothetical protein
MAFGNPEAVPWKIHRTRTVNAVIVALPCSPGRLIG